MQKINRIKLVDFKFFNGECEIDFARKNVLIYGENGSGKSGIYWALYTFIQSVYKTEVAQIRKYFEPTSSENLINFFADDKKKSEITVHLSNGKKEYEKTISLGKINTRNGEVVKTLAQASDFLNYKFLFQIYNFRNSQDIELFPVFERELLLFINFRTNVVRHDGKDGNRNAGEWWNYLIAGLSSSFGKSSPQYNTFETAIEHFDKEFQFYLGEIIQDANDILRDKFKEPLRLSIDYEPCKFNYRTNRNKPTPQVPSTPKVNLRAELLNDKLKDGKENLTRPQIFLNEAKLTAIALSIRLAVLDEKYIKDTPRILVLDDLLISLDMSNREKVLDIIFDDYVKNSQFIILAHDKSFFELVRREISYKAQTDNWILYEMFVDDKDGFEKPFITKTKTLLAKSRSYFAEKDYPACANHLRQAAEEVLNRLIPSIHRRNERGKELTNLGSITEKKGKLHKAQEYFTNRENLSDLVPFLHKIDRYKDTLLNPLSHYNAYSQVYRQELKATIDALTSLNEVKNDVIVPGDKLISVHFQSQKGATYQFIVKLSDDIRLFKLPNKVAFWSKCKLTIKGCVTSTLTNQSLCFTRVYPLLEILDFYDQLATFTETYHSDVDATDTILRADFETQIKVFESGDDLKKLKRY